MPRAELLITSIRKWLTSIADRHGWGKLGNRLYPYPVKEALELSQRLQSQMRIDWLYIDGQVLVRCADGKVRKAETLEQASAWLAEWKGGKAYVRGEGSS